MNTVAPYRLPVYAALAEVFETLVLHGGTEANRSWEVHLPDSLQTREVWTLQVPFKKQIGVSGVWDTQYIHLNCGLLWWLPRFRPHAILTNEMGLRTVLAVLYGRLAGIPVWVQWEGSLHSERNILGVKKRLRHYLARSVRHWVSYGACSTEYLKKIGARPEQLLEVQNCVPHENFTQAPAVAKQWLGGEPKPVLLYVGQLIPRKGLHTLMEACGRLAARGVAFTLVLVGSGPEAEALGEQAAQLGLQHFHILPNQTQGALNEIYRSADVFVLPTLEDVWGLVVNEALWAGTPVLCSRYAGSAEIVPAENVFDPLSEESFDRALARVFDKTLQAADPASLSTCEEVGGMIARSIAQGSPVMEAEVPTAVSLESAPQGAAL